MPCAPRPTRKPSEPPTATTNSAVSTEPTTLRGSSRPDASSDDVPTGPQPPPPTASKAPPNRPRGARNRALGRGPNRSRRGVRNRKVTNVPSAISRAATTGTATSVSRLTSSVAPPKAPRKPGAARTPTVRQSVLPSAWWEIPETSVVPSSEKWMAAEAATGAMPAATSSVAEVTP